MEIGILGPFQVVRDRRVLPLGGHRQRSVLAILTLELRRTVPSERLIELLWGAEPPTRPMAVLQTYVANLRKVLEPNGAPYKTVASRASGYELHLQAESVDAQVFEEQVRLGRQSLAAKDWEKADLIFGSALALWRGPALGEFAGERFAMSAARRLHELRLSATEDRIEAGLSLGHHHRLVPELEGLLEQEPLRERVAKQLMLALYRSARQAEASEVFQRIRRRLNDDLGMEPGPELQQMLKQILNQDPSLAWAQSASIAVQAGRRSTAPDRGTESKRPKSQTRFRTICPVLVGRRTELSLLEENLIESLEGRGRFAIVAGEAGVGKTRLAWELTLRAGELGCQVMTGSCSAVELTLPYLPMLEALGNALAALDLERLRTRLGLAWRDLAQLLPQLKDDERVIDGADPAQAKVRVFEAVVEFLRVTAESAGLLLVIEDLQWADTSTREMLDYMSRRLRNSRVLVLATCRTEEVDRKHPLRPTLDSWQRSGLATIVDLPPLQAADVGDMIRAIFAHDNVADGFRDFMLSRTDGNPFVLEEMLRAATDEGGFRAEVSLVDLPAPGIPRTVREAILQRVARLSEEQVSIVRMASVLGTSFSYSDLMATSSLSEDKLGAALKECVELQLLEAQDRHDFRFRHALTQEAIYQDLLPNELAMYHRRAASALRDTSGAAAGQLAHHLILAGDWDEAIPMLILAAEQAKSRRGYHEAATLYGLAIPHVRDGLERSSLSCSQGEAHYLAGEPAKGEPLLRLGIPTLEASGDRQAAARHRLTLGSCLYVLNRRDEAQSQFEKVKTALESSQPNQTLARAYLQLALHHLNEMNTERGLEMATLATHAAEAAGATAERLWAMNYRGCALIRLGSLDEGFPLVDHSWREALDKGLNDVAFSGLVNAVLIRLKCFKALECGPLLAQLDELADPVLHKGGIATWSFYHKAGRHIALGEMPAARLAAIQALRSAEQNESALALTPFIRQDLAVAESALGQVSAAQALMKDLTLTINSAYWFMRVRLDAEDLEGALEAARLAQSHLTPRPQLLIDEVLQLDKAVEVFLAAKQFANAEQLELKASAAPTVMRPLLDRVEGRMAAARNDMARAEVSLSRSVAALEACSYRDEEWRTRRLLATTRVLRGDDPGAESQLRHVMNRAELNGHSFEALAARRQLQQVLNG